MKLLHSLVLLLCFMAAVAQEGQLTFIGHNTFGGQPLNNCSITVMDNGKAVQSINTGSSADFKLLIPYGKNYSVYFQNAKAQKMYLALQMADIPVRSYSQHITYELSVPYFPKDSKRLDTTQFINPFHKVIFDGRSRMVDDTVYMRKFIQKVYVEKEEPNASPVKTEAPAKWVNLAGKLTYGASKAPLIFKRVVLKDASGKELKATSTNKFGAFIFTGVDMSKVSKVEIDFNKEFGTQQVDVELSNMQKQSLGTRGVTDNKAGWDNNAPAKTIDKLVDTRFAYKISSKLMMESGSNSFFFAGKTVFLLNNKNTIIKKAKTNALGSFVFEDVKPGQTYLIGVDKNEVPEGNKIHLYTNQEKYLARVDSVVPGRYVRRFSAEANVLFNELLIDDSQLKMNVQGKLFGDNVNNPLSGFRILLLSDKYEPIDTTTTDDFGRFMFKYIPYNKDYSISSFNDKDQLLEAINNILVYNSEDELVKIVSGVKGKRFSYKPLSAEQSRLTEIYADDPWLPMMSGLLDKNSSVTIVENIFFESNKFDLLPDAQKTLEKIILVLNANPGIKIELGAHTDSNGNDVYNQTLSEQRAKAASDYIISHGVQASRVISKGYGESRILNRCKNNVFCPDDEHQQNRRIEFKVLKS